jgi:hypothetical protein
MVDDILKTPIPTASVTFAPANRCIYCGATNVKLEDEHIVPCSLNGTMVLPQSSCKACEDVTKKFEQRVARDMYWLFRLKHGYRSRHKRDRPTHFAATVTLADGTTEQRKVAVADYPDLYVTATLPPPGIYTEAPLSDRNPEFQLSLMAGRADVVHPRLPTDNGPVSISFSNTVYWGNLSRLLAQIAHGYLVACIGFEGYIPFLPDLILGRSGHLSHYVGGIAGAASMTMLSHHISLLAVPCRGEQYLAVDIHLLATVPMPTYQVVAAKVTDTSCFAALPESQRIGLN